MLELPATEKISRALDIIYENAHAVLLATNHETVEVKVAPIECDLEQVVQRGDAAVAALVETPPWLDHLDQDHLSSFLAPSFSRSPNYVQMADCDYTQQPL